MSDTSCQPCVPVCPGPFARVVADFQVAGGTRVTWSLRPDFLDPLPYAFTLEVGQSDNPNADDWTAVGAPTTNTYVAVDGEQRSFSTIRWQFYRVKLVTARGTYYSSPVGPNSAANRRDWRIAREAVRQELVRMRAGAGVRGFLLKRRITGTLCSCVDKVTREVINPACPYCYGTGYQCGYFFPIDCAWADLDPRAQVLGPDPARGTVSSVIVKARMACQQQVVEFDVWVNARTDDRYFVNKVDHLAEVNGIPVAYALELRLAPASDILYTIPIPDQLLSLAEARRGI